ncbi:hypothetical protein [Lentibacter algarum]|uniref:hypothetical protein n=1 Tax=Lentibacter algarum TaxID=576131 RepID=UPI002356A1F4|nr:hypothetical protein [Lentibacter algarum]MCO4826784.1 hypothetical protein [Lentibacter algarum]
MTELVMRPPEQVMTLSRLGSLHQCRLSFMRQLLRRMRRENWQISRPRFEINIRGEGVAVYTAKGPQRSYSLIAFAHDLPDEMRSDRVIATAWDATFTLFDGTPTPDDVERLRANVPLQEAGRVSNKELSLSRANRSARLWNYVVDCLAKGEQPEAEELTNVGYLMRTTAVYGSGKFGASDRAFVAARPEFEPPFQVEMLSVYLTRAFVADLVEHMAALKAPDKAVSLKPSLRRSLGIGNSTGLGMAPFLVNHPRLLNNWITAREYALAKIRALPDASVADIGAFKAAFEKACGSVALWKSDHPIQQAKLAALRKDITALQAKLVDFTGAASQPWNALYLWSESALSEEGQELLVSLLMEPQSALLEGLGACMQADEHALFRIDGAMPLSDLKALIQTHYAWALATDWQSHEASARLWYVSEAKLEPRLGERFEEPLEPYEQPLAPGRDASLLFAALENTTHKTVAAFLAAHPEHRHIVRRVQMAPSHPYGEIRDNTISASMKPIDMLRAKLSFFGATHFDPRSDRWVRINMFRGAPYPNELVEEQGDTWVYGATP